MLARDDILRMLAEQRHALDRHHVRTLLLFGSFSRNEARERSDVDLLVEFDRPVGLFALARLRGDLEHWLGREVDLSTTDSLPAEVRERVMREALRAA